MSMPSATQIERARPNGRRAGVGQESSGSAAVADPIAALRMPRNAAPEAPKLPRIVSNHPSVITAIVENSTSEAAADPGIAAALTVKADEVVPVDAASAPVQPNSLPLKGAAEVREAAPGEPESVLPAVVSARASSAAESAPEPAPEPAHVQHSNDDSGSQQVQAVEADQQSNSVSASGKGEEDKPNSSSVASSSAAEFSFKRAPRKSTKASVATASNSVAPTTTAAPFPTDQNSSSATRAVVSESNNSSSLTANQAPLVEVLPPSQPHSETNGHEATEGESGEIDILLPEGTAEQEPKPSGPAAGTREQESSAPMEGIVEQPRSPPAGSQEHQPSVSMEGIVEEASTPSADGAVQPSDPLPLPVTNAAFTTPLDIPAKPAAAEYDCDLNTPSRPGAAAEARSGPTDSELHPQTPPSPAPEKRPSTGRNSLPDMSGFTNGEPAAMSIDSSIQEGNGEPPSVQARIQGVKRNSYPASFDTPQPAARRGSFRWQVSTTNTNPQGSRGVGQVVEESSQPRDKLKGFWEEQGPVPGQAANHNFTRYLSTSTGNEGKKWSVKLSQPLANGKLIDLSYFKDKSVAAIPAPPPTFDINIGDAFYSLTDLQGMSGNDGIDPSQKEMYLSDNVFQEAFGSDKASFGSKPKWRQVILKKKVGLF